MKSIYLAYNNLLNHKSVLEAGSGASEFQIILLAKSLADKGFDVTCFNRGPLGKIDNVNYRSYNDIINNKDIEVNTPLIFWRFFDVIPKLLEFYNPNKIILWSHDHKGLGLSKDVGELINKNRMQIVAVSDFHKNSLTDFIESSNISTIHNALYSEVYKYSDSDNNKIDKNAVTFGSCLAKGIEVVLKLFDQLYLKHPNFYLNILSPSYSEIPANINKPYTRIIGNVKNKVKFCEILQSSLCTVSTEFPETFGCIFAESYYLKTPVIATNKINGMHEFINKKHTCNLKDYNDFEKLLLSFYNNRPSVTLDKNFLDVNIVNLWENIIKDK